VWLSGEKRYKLRLTIKAYKRSYNYKNYTINLVGRSFGKLRRRRLHSGGSRRVRRMSFACAVRRALLEKYTFYLCKYCQNGSRTRTMWVTFHTEIKDWFVTNSHAEIHTPICNGSLVPAIKRKPVQLLFCHFSFYKTNTVGVTTDHGLDDRGVGARVPVGLRSFTSPYRPDRLWVHSASYPMGIGGSFQGIKRQVREADHSQPTSAEAKKMWTPILVLS
jgi:hypothetical protein